MIMNLRTVLFLASVALIVSNASVLAHTDVTPEQAHDLIDSTEDLVVVDVRERSEYCDARGHIPGALNYPLNSGVLAARYEELPMDCPILVVCRSGGRSNVAANFLDSQGFPEGYDMTGGMNAWLWETAPCKYAGGSGTPEDPYQIATAADLIALGETPADYDKHFILTADIDLDPNLPGGKVFDRAVIGIRWQTPFAGAFDGNNHEIRNLIIEALQSDFIALFGFLDSEAVIANLGLEAVDVKGRNHVGGLVGSSDGHITNSYITGMVYGEDYIGGLVGGNEGRITNSGSTAMVAGNRHVGGLVGWSGGSTINSYSTSTLNGGHSVGGLIGSNRGSITNSYSTSTVNGTGDSVGGFVGENWGGGRIANSFSTGTVAGGSYVGGLVGENTGISRVLNSYSTAMVTGNRRVGGLVGSCPGSILNSFSTGTVTGNQSVGGLVGSNLWANHIISCFWDMQTSGQTSSPGGVGLATTEMQRISTYLSSGWDFVDESVNGTCDYWEMSPAEYPTLRFFADDRPTMPEGFGSAEQPYLIRDAWDLGTVWVEPDAHYRLEASLDLSGITWSIAVVPWFDGSFDGNGFVISHLHIQGGSYLGLFGRLNSGAMITNLGMETVDVDGAGECFGGLVGWNEGSITNSCSTGTVTGGSFVGGLVGTNKGRVTNSYSTGTVSGGSYVGGLGGETTGSIDTCYSTGTVSGDQYAGGLVGMRHPDYSIVIDCFWDVQTSRLESSVGGTGLTTVEMQTASLFLEAGWDFVGETENGPEDIWWIDEGQDYPRLWWEAADAEF